LQAGLAFAIWWQESSASNFDCQMPILDIKPWALPEGKWISIAYFGVVALLFWISKKQNLEPRGGWSK
jgi:hypothetical protein